jgi:hypothetical protein
VPSLVADTAAATGAQVQEDARAFEVSDDKRRAARRLAGKTVCSVAAAAFAVLIPELASGQSCQPVAGTALEQFYPVMPGWTRGKPSSETDPEERVSRTTVDFDRKMETISVELMDSCRNPNVLMLIREALKAFPPGGPGTTQRHTTVHGFPAYEEFTAVSGHGEIHVLVADRFMVKVTGDTTDLPTVQNAATQIPMQKLAAAK